MHGADNGLGKASGSANYFESESEFTKGVQQAWGGSTTGPRHLNVSPL